MKMPANPMYGRWFRPLLPRLPFTCCSSKSGAYPYPTPTHCYSLHNPNIPSWILPPRGVSDRGGGRETVPLVSSRWHPSAEQVHVLQELYRQGTRAPSAAEIQQIVAKLRRFGKVKGKNVFYWFQNHKARDRQKQRLQTGKHAQIPRRKQSGRSSRKYSVNVHPKKFSTLSDYGTYSKYYESMHGAMEQEMQQKVCNDEKGPAEENAYYPFAALKILPPKYNYFRNTESGIKENQTLELFPERCINGLSRVEEETNDNSRLVPNQFFEFLPTKI